MKKVLAILLALAMVFCFAACGGEKKTGGEEKKAAWPNGTITLLIGYEEGSLTANNCVTLVDWLQSKGCTVECEYDKVGGGANLVTKLLKAEPDGQTLMLFGMNCINNYYDGTWKVDPTDTKLFRAVASTPQPWPYSGCMVLTQPDAPYSNFAELEKYINEHEGEVTAASIPGKVMDPKLKSFLIQTGLADKVRWLATTSADGDAALLGGTINLLMADEASAYNKFKVGEADALAKAIINLRPDDDFSYYPPETPGLDKIKAVPTLAQVFGEAKAKEINIPNTSCWVVPAGTPDEICEQIAAMFDAIDDEPASTDEKSFYARCRMNGGTSKYWKLSYDEIVAEYARIAPIIKKVVDMNAAAK